MGILAIGAGAGEGLQDHLMRLLRERQQSEVERHNLAAEQQSSRALDLNSQLRQDSINERQEQAAASLGERKRQDTEKRASLRGIGDTVTEPEYTEERAAGSPSGNYDITPGKTLRLSGFKSLPEGQRPDVQPNDTESIKAPRLINFKGTGKQRDERDDNERAQAKNTADTLHQRNTETMAGMGLAERTRHDKAMENKPVAGSFSPVQSGDNYIKFDRKTGKFTDASGQEVTNPSLATPGSVRQRMNMADKVKTHVQETMDLVEEADKKGLLGPLMGRWNDLVSNRIGSSGNPDTDELTGQLAFNLSGLRTGFANVHGGARGGGSIQMAQLWKDIYDSRQMSKERLLGALKAEQKWLDTYGSGSGKTETGSTPNRVRYDMNGNQIK